MQISLASIITVLDCRTRQNVHKMPFTLYGRSSTRRKLDMVIQPMTAKGISLPYLHCGMLVRYGYLELIKYACDF